MLRRFLTWFEDYLADVGAITLIGAVTGILAFGGTLSTIFGDTGIRATAFVATILTVLGTFTALATSRRQWQHRARQNQRLLGHYRRLVQDHFNYWQILEWDETVVVDERGNSRQRITARAVVTSDDLDFFRIRLGSRWKQSTKHQRHVSVKARSPELDGLGGTRLDTTLAWLPDGRLEILVHFSLSMEKNDIFNVDFEIEWPGKCQPLMLGEPDEFVMRFTQRIEKATWTIILPVGTKVSVDPVGLRAEDTYELKKGVNSAGNSEVRLSAQAIEPYRSFGMRVDQK
ncbi:hypothetical protein EV192_112134 [Actinocrispum wychmicini]|uniref:Uncharacterized protein n=2 Tax=Actinocrispum wychmicini TaxID=1213861 RepID=A0A4R2J507_9PSEU|nr:hypothetical protein EV192_112134 [Actinocrispum wychmicini]